MKRKIICGILLAASLLTSFAFASVSKWAERELKKAEESGLCSWLDSEADMQAAMTQGELASLTLTLYHKLLPEDTTTSAAIDPEKSFSNAVEIGIIPESSEKKMNYVDTAAREDAFLYFYRMIAIAFPEKAVVPTYILFEDINEFSNLDTRDAACYLYSRGIMKGAHDLSGAYVFNGICTMPADPITYEQALVLAQRLLESFPEFNISPSYPNAVSNEYIETLLKDNYVLFEEAMKSARKYPGLYARAETNDSGSSIYYQCKSSVSETDLETMERFFEIAPYGSITTYGYGYEDTVKFCIVSSWFEQSLIYSTSRSFLEESATGDEELYKNIPLGDNWYYEYLVHPD